MIGGKMFTLGRLGLCSGLIVGLCACGGSGGSSSQSTSSNSKTGTFIDSPVMGLSYSSPSHSGLTNSAGEFTYTEGETVSFSLGGIALGSSIASEVVTPLDLLGAESIDDAISSGLFDQLINMLVFLQSLDRDHNPNNGIDLGDLDTALANEELVFDLDQDLFLNTVYKRIVNENAGVYVTADAAKKHFADSLGVTYTVALPSKDYLDTDGDSNNDIVISYNYDANGRLSEIFEAPGGDIEMPPTNKTTLQYDSDNRLTLLTYEDLAGEVLLVEREYNYDSMGRLTSLVESGPSSDIYLQESWVYDEVGNEIRYESSVTDMGGELFQTYQNPFDQFFKIKPYHPDNEIQVPLPSIFDKNPAPYYPDFLGTDALEITSYETDGSLASQAVTRTFNWQSVYMINTTENLTFDHGRRLTSMYEADIEAFNFYYESEISYNYAEDETLTSCEFLFIQNDIPSEVIVSYESEVGDTSTYSCGDLGADETIVLRDGDGDIESVIYNGYGGDLIVRNEQNIFYDEEKVVGVFTETTRHNVNDSFFTTEISSTQYDYNSAGDLSFIEESSNGLRTLTREYQPIEIR